MALANKTDSFTGTGNGSATKVGKGYFGFSYGTGSSPVGTLLCEISFDDGSTYQTLKVPGGTSDASMNAAGVLRLFNPMEGAIARTRCSAYTSGTLVGGIHQ
ncbi:MAG: hypothetical protein FJX11_23975 [Alphaproteobacteria bacterium]|nr:hypothetical protein [Alphaproteobacteria bacterium]